MNLSADTLLPGEKLEPLSPTVSVIVSKNHTFNTDTILLAWYSRPRRGEICADFGSGCGTIPLIWCSRSDPARAYAVELQEDACSMLSRSAALNGLEQKIQVIHQDIKELKSSGSLPLDLDRISCNPPYKPRGTGVFSAEEGARIARHEVACDLSDIASAAAGFLRWGGSFFCCMRPERLCETMSVLSGAGLEPKQIRFVQQRKDKVPFLFLLRAARGGKPGMAVEPVLLVESEQGGWSDEMLKIYGEYKENHLCKEN